MNPERNNSVTNRKCISAEQSAQSGTQSQLGIYSRKTQSKMLEIENGENFMVRTCRLQLAYTWTVFTKREDPALNEFGNPNQIH